MRDVSAPGPATWRIPERVPIPSTKTLQGVRLAQLADPRSVQWPFPRHPAASTSSHPVDDEDRVPVRVGPGRLVRGRSGRSQGDFDRIFPACAKFEKRIYTEIATADLRLRIDGSFQEPPRVAVEPLVGVGNNQPSREVEEPHTEVAAPHSARWRAIIDAIPSQKKRIVRLWDGGRRRSSRTLASVINSGKKLNATVERQKRAYLRRRNEFILLLLFALAFFVVATLHLATSSTEQNLLL